MSTLGEKCKHLYHFAPMPLNLKIGEFWHRYFTTGQFGGGHAGRGQSGNGFTPPCVRPAAASAARKGAGNRTGLPRA